MNSAELSIADSEPVENDAASWRDMVGIVASIGCAIHCAAMPFVIAYLPALGLSFLADEAFHKWMALICFLIAIAAFLPGLRKHGNWLPVGVGSVGLFLISFAAFGLAGECCPSCEAGTLVQQTTSAEHRGVPSGGVAGVEAGQLSSGCEDCHDCEHCEHSTAADAVLVAHASDEVPVKSAGILSLLGPWITPLGGMLLVSAHLLNRRCGCPCDCCSE